MNNKVARGIAAIALTVAGTMTLGAGPAVATEVRAQQGSAPAAGGSLGRLGALADLAVERLRVGDDVAAAKFGTDSPIEDPAREQQVLDQVRAQAATLGLDPDTTAAFFRDQITASKVVQRGLFTRWTSHPGEAPTTRPDLGQIRTRLDRLTTGLLAELKTTVDIRAQRTPCAVQLALATGSAVILERLDTLHRQALGTAVRSVCTVPSGGAAR